MPICSRCLAGAASSPSIWRRGRRCRPTPAGSTRDRPCRQRFEPSRHDVKPRPRLVWPLWRAAGHGLRATPFQPASSVDRRRPCAEQPYRRPSIPSPPGSAPGLSVSPPPRHPLRRRPQSAGARARQPTAAPPV
ncbi:hypothetical protein G6F46_014932 [Rhizopus delemar]|nr:hypothetical protein G6F46_014932 [Rhizopus delemar]